ncbi:hypothetical protein CJ030_MR1G000269 [Morella rubra]|uniref:Uncharacterized protein n=1 Tax=Morella rubra TaxID=262757 RepID=A0A6A1WPX1_9ROSI|nr:hypothetical protein CJ030_MR1G000269 [Morella rubra]
MPVRGIEMMSDDSIGAFYIHYGGRLYCVRNLGDESDYFLQSESHPVSSRFSSSVMCGSSWSANEALKFYDIRVHEHEKSNSRSSDGIRPDYDQFVEFVYHFETDEGHLKSPLVLRAPKDHSLGPIGFGVYIPAKWFLERSNNLEGWSYIKASVEIRSWDVEVKEYGVRLYCRNSASELYYAFKYFAYDLVHYLDNCYWGTYGESEQWVGLGLCFILQKRIQTKDNVDGEGDGDGIGDSADSAGADDAGAGAEATKD